METINLIRQDSTDAGTFSTLVTDSLRLYAVENTKLIIPVGSYICRYTLSPRLKKYTYEVMRVPGRTGIRIHSANFGRQLLGCIAPAERLGTMDGVMAALLSRPAVTKLEIAMQRKEFTLEIYYEHS